MTKIILIFNSFKMSYFIVLPEIIVDIRNIEYIKRNREGTFYVYVRKCIDDSVRLSKTSYESLKTQIKDFNENQIYKNKYEKVKGKYEKLKTHVLYSPGGSEYLKAQKRFEENSINI